MKRYVSILIYIMFVALVLVASGAEARPVATGVRVGHFEKNDRFVLEISEEVATHSFTLENPNRLVIDMPSIDWAVPAHQLKGFTDSRSIGEVRYGAFKRDQSRVVLDLNQPVRVVQSFVIPPDKETRFYRIVFDLAPSGNKGWYDAIRSEEVPAKSAVIPPSKSPLATPVAKPSSPFKPMIIIDAGHGGEDPGARGRTGTWEKYVTLKYAIAVRDALQETGRYRVHLTRSDDRFLKLRHRVSIGRKEGGQLFISLHADSSPNRDARGLSVYTLSDRASDEEAAALAARENKVDILSDIDLSDKDEDVAEILIDLAQRETKNKSSEFAETLVRELGREINLVRNTHRFAGFAVLKAPDVPSVLVELGFLSNRKDEALLNSTDYRKKVVRGITRAIDAHFDKQKK